MINIILLAAPAAGKGTISKALKEKYDYVHISTGDLLREAIAKGDSLGKKLKEVLNQGLLVEDQLMNEILEKRLSEKDVGNGFILDGFPRNLKQAQSLEEILNRLKLNPVKVIVLDVAKETLQERVTGRRLCKNCGAIYNIYNPEHRPKIENVCDLCHSELYQRTDDNEETFLTRYQTYLDQSLALLDFYKTKGNLSKVDASGGSSEALSLIEELLNLS